MASASLPHPAGPATCLDRGWSGSLLHFPEMNGTSAEEPTRHRVCPVMTSPRPAQCGPRWRRSQESGGLVSADNFLAAERIIGRLCRVVCQTFPQRTASVLAVGPRLCIRHLARGCQHPPPPLPPQQTRFAIVTHPQSLTRPVPHAQRCTAARLQPRWLQLIAAVPLSASALTGTNHQLAAAAHATRGCWLE